MQFDQFVAKVKRDPELVQELQKDPVNTLQRYQSALHVPDTWIYRIVVLSLGLTVIIAAVGGICLAVRGVTDTPDILVALGSAAVGALAGLLAPVPAST
jgi:hypothetical protein